MKSFIRFLTEDIVGGIPGPESYDTTTYKQPRRTRKIRDLDSLVSAIGKNYAPTENTRIVPLNNDFHIAIDHHEQENGYHRMNVRVLSSKPGHENTSLMNHSLTSGGNDFFTAEGGRRIRTFSGTPMKNRIGDVKSGVFRLPKNYLHTIANATGFGIMSGGMQSPGAISMWRKAVHHGHRENNSVHRVLAKGSAETYPGEKSPREAGDFAWTSYGRMTPRNFSDAYTGDVSRKKTGNKSRVPAGTIKTGSEDRLRIQDQIAMGNRAESKLLVVPREPK